MLVKESAESVPTESAFLEAPEPVYHRHIARRSSVPIFHNLLGIVECGAVLAVAVLVWLSIGSMTDLNRFTVSAWVFATPTPAPFIQAVVLPDGHTSPNSPGGARPNEAEIPAHLRGISYAFASLPTPTAAPQHGVRIQIPSLDIDAPIVQGDGWEQLMKGVGQHPGTANPGEAGNMVLSGHNDVYGEVFRYLDRLKPGDQVIVFTARKSFVYIVDGWILVEPDRVDVMNPTREETLTLISCYPYLIDTQRIVVKASLLKS